MYQSAFPEDFEEKDNPCMICALFLKNLLSDTYNNRGKNQEFLSFLHHLGKVLISSLCHSLFHSSDFSWTPCPFSDQLFIIKKISVFCLNCRFKGFEIGLLIKIISDFSKLSDTLTFELLNSKRMPLYQETIFETLKTQCTT